MAISCDVVGSERERHALEFSISTFQPSKALVSKGYVPVCVILNAEIEVYLRLRTSESDYDFTHAYRPLYALGAHYKVRGAFTKVTWSLYESRVSDLRQF